MVVGQYKGEDVHKARKKIKELLITNNEAVVYYEPGEKCSGENCVVSFCEQKYV